jgi:hypothetical protein
MRWCRRILEAPAMQRRPVAGRLILFGPRARKPEFWLKLKILAQNKPLIFQRKSHLSRKSSIFRPKSPVNEVLCFAQAHIYAGGEKSLFG